MNGVNLIPAERIMARRCAMRIRKWLAVVPSSATLLFAAFVINWLTGSSDPAPVRAALAQTEEKIKETQLRVSKQKRDLKEAEANLKANRAVGEQPDWSLLLSLLASRLGDDAALTACTLEPVAPPTPLKGSAAPKEPPPARADKMKLFLQGVSKTQESASRFVLKLESSGAFDAVNLVETMRTPSGDGIGFKIECDISDAGVNAK